ncbi:MAG: F-type H+-transporting ATPase subunit delta [Acidimicrobiaceae bacterium]|nr:F-type H+-transporting ATPase subunit delta [Acidimicrobiaceae bacterium]MDQ1365386.1 F-type H+-transporting ATPase subunit delta [Acidimicrobiaceae bacterium]MDQ1399424.1 F-type H+-transporting ATPase subunit delta [Acidimicrobiaceae bacterium]MDQ1413944.1 F-type H+-transporting ATPase subunit delta [Acidimicrobiaceae bacterium]MDQ1417384.1 F-type H+-transporting ATPase subunit delta [Acidimicrobiaceae bacterium]
MADLNDAYAAALFQIAKAEGNLERIEDELFRFARTLESNEDLRMSLTDSTIPVERRQNIVQELLGGKALPVTVALISFVVGVGRGRTLPEIIDRLVAKAAEERKEAVAEIRTAFPLDDAHRKRLAEALGRATGKKISIKEVIDPSVLGGVTAIIGDTVIDGTIRHRLEQLRESL